MSFEARVEPHARTGHAAPETAETPETANGSPEGGGSTSGSSTGGDQSEKLLEPLRGRLDDVDRQILDLLVERMDICRDVARLKVEHDIPMMQPGRVGVVVERARAHATAHGLPADYLGDIYERIIAETCVQEDALIVALRGEDTP
jgi:chorismate mutase-like protein